MVSGPKEVIDVEEQKQKQKQKQEDHCKKVMADLRILLSHLHVPSVMSIISTKSATFQGTLQEAAVVSALVEQTMIKVVDLINNKQGDKE